MTSNIDFNISEATLLAMELDTISFAGLSAGESLVVEFSVFVGGTDIDNWTAKYYADSSGRITLTALGWMWNLYLLDYRRRPGREGSTPQTIPDLLTVEITYTMEDETSATCQRHLLYSRHRPNPALSSLLSHHPFVSKVRHTAQAAKEYVTALSELTNVTVKADAICLINGVQSTRTIAASSFPWSSSLGGGSIDVSPSVISSLLPNGAVLKEYTITMLESNVEKDSCRYIVDSAVAVRQLCWLNRWGVYETLVLKGSETLKASRAATYGYTGDDWSALDMEVTDEYECSTGYVGENEWSQVRDMAESPIVWLWDGVWHRVTITDAKLSRLRPTNEARSCVVTYRLSDREEIIL